MSPVQNPLCRNFKKLKSTFNALQSAQLATPVRLPARALGPVNGPAALVQRLLRSTPMRGHMPRIARDTL